MTLETFKRRTVGKIHRIQFEHGGASLHVELPCAEVVDLYVDPKYRGLGLGQAYLEELIRLARNLGAKRVVAHVEPGNLASHRAFERQGFAITATEDHMELEFAGCAWRK